MAAILTFKFTEEAGVGDYESRCTSNAGVLLVIKQ